MHVDGGPPIRCLPLILISMCVVTVVLVHMGSHQQSLDNPPGILALKRYGMLIPPDDVLDTLSVEDLQELLTRYLATIQMECDTVTRIGSDLNGNVLCSNLNTQMPKPCNLYSFGYRGDFSFEAVVATKFGCNVFSFDPKNNARKSPNPNVKLYDVKLGDSDREENSVKVKRFSSIQSLVNQENEGRFTIVKIEVDPADQREAVKEIIGTKVLSDG